MTNISIDTLLLTIENAGFLIPMLAHISTDFGLFQSDGPIFYLSFFYRAQHRCSTKCSMFLSDSLFSILHENIWNKNVPAFFKWVLLISRDAIIWVFSPELWLIVITIICFLFLNGYPFSDIPSLLTYYFQLYGERFFVCVQQFLA